MTSAMPVRYEETARDCNVDLSDNTNLWGTPPSVSKALRGGEIDRLSRYPSAYSDELKREIGQYADVDASAVVVGCGSDDVLDSAIRAFGGPGKLLVQIDPTFSMIPVFAAVSGLDVKSVSPLAGEFADEVVSSPAAITYLCSPNNPTGAILRLTEVEEILARAAGLVIVDEAYIDFGGESAIGLLRKFDNLLITRTFSKAFGLAGFRVGYGLGSPVIAARVEAARGPYKVSSISEGVAIEVLQNDREWVRECVTRTIVNRNRFTAQLVTLGLDPIPGSANFVLVPVADATATERRLRASGVAVRKFRRLTGIGDALRISIGPWPMMQQCLDALGEAFR